MVKIKDYAYNISFYTIDSTGLFNYECSVLRNKALGDFLVSENAISVEKDHELNKVIDEYDLDEDNYILVTVTKEMVSTIQKNFEKFGLYNFTLPERNYTAVVNKIYFATVTLANDTFDMNICSIGDYPKTEIVGD